MNITINKIFRPLLESLPENNRLERIWILAKVDFKRRYYNSSLGLFWALLNPLFRLTIYYTVFTIIFPNKIENFALYIFSGILVWLFFAEASKKSFSVLKSKRYLIENIPFNKIDLFYSSVFSVFFGFLFNIGAFFIMALFLGVSFSIHIFWLPALVINMLLLVLAVSLLLATIHIYLNDIHQIWDMVILAGYWANPIFYPSDILFDKAPMLLYLNPIAGLIINIRETVIYANAPNYELLCFDFIFTLTLLLLSVNLFNKYSHKAIEKL